MTLTKVAAQPALLPGLQGRVLDVVSHGVALHRTALHVTALNKTGLQQSCIGPCCHLSIQMGDSRVSAYQDLFSVRANYETCVCTTQPTGSRVEYNEDIEDTSQYK